MPLKSDIVVDAAKFLPGAINEQTKRVNQHLIDIFTDAPRWYEVGAARYRQMRINGETPLPAPKYLDAALAIVIPSRDAGRIIPCRLVYPSSRKTVEDRKGCKGTMLHIHGGGWVLGDHNSADVLLQYYADAGDLAILSAGYRLAPEDPYPAGPDDCTDVAEYLIKNSDEEYGGPFRFIGGESAGAHLSLLTALHLLRTLPSFHLTGLLLHFGVYDISLLPAAQTYTKPLILNRPLMDHFLQAFIPCLSSSPQLAKNPDLSPYYTDLEPFRGRLPPALFTCGTDDPLLDDSVNMGVKWQIAGGKGVVRIFPGAPHAFIGFPSEVLEEAGRAVKETGEFIGDCLAESNI